MGRIHSTEDPIIDGPSNSQTQSDPERLLAPSEGCRRRLTEEKGTRDFATQTVVEWPPDLVIPEGSSRRFRDSRDFATQTTVVWPPELVVPEEDEETCTFTTFG